MKNCAILSGMLFMFLMHLETFAQTDRATFSDRPEVLGHGVGLFKVGSLLAEDDFDSLENWVVQVQDRSGFPPARVETRGNTLDCLLPGRGCTVWFKKKFPTRVAIT